MTNRQRVDVLDRGQCLRLLGTVRVGRLVFTEDDQPAVQPVNFRLHQGHVVIRIAGGAKLAAATGNAVVAFEADELDADLHSGWSVTVVGRAGLITDVNELVEMSGTFLQPWVAGRRDHFIRILTEKVTGRRLHPPVTAQPRPAT
ncbi:pyridoxamine 5'-phosphate oxidase family protein [Actinophytocola sp. NPDC049390]|uniref:pyridoxamine 5'-phosphate oxidase family protein n=1 Tax=Actinophytocola sp. NPDC049390 TaxID=3363894 RepID=UPI003799AE50